MKQIHIILILVCTNIIAFALFFYQFSLDTSSENTSGLNLVTSIDTDEISFEDALRSDGHFYDIFHRIQSQDDINFFDDFYTAFQKLSSYEEYKEFTNKYPSLLPVIYAAKLRDRENYLKFYDFIFDRVLEENIPRYIQDLKEMPWAEWLEWEALRWPFMSEIARQYEIIATWVNPFSLNLWHGPIHIALTWDSIEVAYNNCDISEVSWVDQLSRQECYDYVLHYRATEENWLCDQLFWEYDRAICRWSFNSDIL